MLSGSQGLEGKKTELNQSSGYLASWPHVVAGQPAEGWAGRGQWVTGWVMLLNLLAWVDRRHLLYFPYNLLPTI